MNSSRKQKSGPNGKVDTRHKWKKIVAVGALGAAIVFAGICNWNSRKPVPDMQNPINATIVQPDCPKLPAPMKDDGKCEIDKGEHDSTSDNWDPKSCGYCGDGKKQPFETAKECPVDFHCGDGKVVWQQTFGAFKPLGEDKLRLGTVTVYETCFEGHRFYCLDDCGGKAWKMPTANPADVKNGATLKGAGAGGVSGTDSATMMEKPKRPKVTITRIICQMPIEQSPMFRTIKSSIRSKIKMRTSRIWSKGVPKEKDSVALVRLEIQNGRINRIFATVKWKGGKKNFSARTLGINNLVGKNIGYRTTETCFMTVDKKIPSIQ